MKKRDRRLTPTCAPLTAGWDEAVSREITEVKPGKNWLLERLKKIATVKIIKGYETARRR